MTEWTEFIPMASIFLFFAVVHSVTASRRFKRWIARRTGSRFAFYRFFYNVLSIVMFAAVILAYPKADATIYEVTGAGFFLFWGLRLSAAAFFVWSLFAFDAGEFLGTNQVRRFFSGTYNPENEAEAAEALKLNTSGAFKWCRHPVYLFAILMLVFQPVVTVGYAVLAGMTILYFWIGAVFEERRMVRLFGAEYVRYQREVPRFIPWRVVSGMFLRKQS